MRDIHLFNPSYSLITSLIQGHALFFTGDESQEEQPSLRDFIFETQSEATQPANPESAQSECGFMWVEMLT